MSNLAHIADRVLNRPLMIMPEKLAIITEVLAGRIGVDASYLGQVPDASRFSGSNLDEDATTGRKTAMPYKRTGDGVAVITIAGSLVNRGAWIGASSGLVSYEGIKFQLAQAAADPKVASIVLDLESPGGEAVGAFETADAVRAAAAQKPVTAIVNGMAASAGYAIASGASRIVTTPTGIAGSIGVVMLHADYSRMLDREGVTPTMIFAGAHKVDGNPYAPLPAGVRADLQAEIDQFYGMFVDTVAAGRKKLSAKAIRGTEARTFMGADAVSAGLADEVGTFEDVLSNSSKPRGRSAASRRATMDTQDATFTRADLDKARAEGHAEGHRAGLDAGKTEGLKLGADGERARIKTILGSDEAKDREASARHLALSTAMSVEDARGALAGVSKTTVTSLADRAANVSAVVVDEPARTGNATKGPAEEAPKQKGAVAWSDIIASVTPKKRG